MTQTVETIQARIEAKADKELKEQITQAFVLLNNLWPSGFFVAVRGRQTGDVEVKVSIYDLEREISGQLFENLKVGRRNNAVSAFMREIDELRNQVDELAASVQQ